MQPQRPLRTLRVHGDENLPPVANAMKTLHSRNKSSPALSTMAAAGALKGAVKRTAFGDVSNTANIYRPSRDDSVISGKNGYEINEKVIKVQQDKKSAALLRPAQRPLSVSNLRGLVNNVSTVATVTTKSVVTETQQPLQSANTRKVLSKRSTAILKDFAVPQPEQHNVDQHKSIPAKAPLAPVHRDLNPKENPNASNILEEPQPELRRTQSKQVVPPEIVREEPVPSAPTSSEIISDAYSEAAYIDDNGDVQYCEYTDETDHVETISNGVVDAITLPQEAEEIRYETSYQPLVETQKKKVQSELSYKHKLLPVSEPEEYWDDEEDEDNYDEDGYVTARSYKSGRDNTTGGATTILFPKVNNKIKKEIAAAKELVEASRTPEEIEDEAWDMSMVAEYGDEIFAYMKELEVSLSFKSAEEVPLTLPDRSRCSLMPTTWTIRRKYNGLCVPSSWTGSSRFTIVSASFQKHSSSASTILIASSPARLFLWVSFSLLVPQLFSSRQNTKR